MKILVTGATGFIGQHVISNLLADGLHVIATSRNEEKAKKFDWYNEVEYFQCDYHRQLLDYYNYFGRPDALIHLAWNGLPKYNDSFHVEENLPANCKFLKNFVDNKIKKLVVAGTCYEYGMKNGPLSEDCCTLPVTQYGLAKDSLRKYLELILRDSTTSFNWTRLFFLYGKGQNPSSLMPQLEQAIAKGAEVFNMSGGEQLRDYLPVEIVAEYICRITVQLNMEGIVNCCSGEPISIRRLVETYLSEHDSNISLNLGYYPYPDYEPMAFWGNPTKLKKIIGDI